jgi:hypothetical protein
MTLTLEHHGTVGTAEYHLNQIMEDPDPQSLIIWEVNFTD